MPAPLSAERQPFVLLDDARRDGAAHARLFRAPTALIVAERADEVAAALAAVDAALAQGRMVAGLMAYEAGAALDGRLAGDAGVARGEAAADAGPLIWLGVFDGVERIAPADVAALLPDPAGAWLGAPRPMIDMAAYSAAIEQVIGYIRAGDIYQANLTFPAELAIHGHPLAAYAALRRTAQAGYGGVVYTGAHWHLSASPELFFAHDGTRITTKPMKGTARRGADAAADAAAIAALAADPKQRAENLMIVDLLRNDLSRIAAPGSVHVPELFAIETYPTIHQMVSRVAARLRADTPCSALVEALFPCGSITGAPKRRAMEIIGEVETAPRGPYTGAIGYAAPAEAAFNVAIRTLSLPGTGDPAGPHRATLGLGSGIVADSVAWAEWDECLAKGEFVTRASGSAEARFDLIETMAFDPHHGISRLDRHLARLGASAAAFGFAFDRHRLRNELQAATFRQRDPARIRLRLGAAGDIAIMVDPMPETPAGPVAVAIAPLGVDPADFRLRHKTSARDFYDAPRRASGAWEVLFTLPDGQLSEGSFTNIFVADGDVLLTPPRAIGLLPGILRDELIAEGRAREARLVPGDLADGLFIGNSLRGLIPARLAGCPE